MPDFRDGRSLPLRRPFGGGHGRFGRAFSEIDACREFGVRVRNEHALHAAVARKAHPQVHRSQSVRSAMQRERVESQQVGWGKVRAKAARPELRTTKSRLSYVQLQQALNEVDVKNRVVRVY